MRRDAPGSQAAPPGALGHRAGRGAAILTAAQGVKFLCQLASTVVLARLLSPHDFGVFAMLMPLVGFVFLLQDFGLPQAVVTLGTRSHAEESTLFYVNLALSFVLAAGFAAAAPSVAAFYRAPEAVGPARALAASIALSGLATLQFGFLARDLRFAAMALADVAGAVMGLLAAVAVALWRPGPWPMVAAVLANMATGLLCGWIATGWRPGRPGAFAAVRPLLRFGGGVIGADMATYLTRNADNVLIARYLGPVPLGYYDRGYKLLLLPLQQIVGPLGRVVIPVLSRLAGEPARYAEAYARGLDWVLLATVPGMVAALVLADPLIVVAMGERWRPVVPAFQWLGLVGLQLPLAQTLAWLLISQNRTGTLAALAAFGAATSIAGYLLGLRYGIVGVAAIFAGGDWLVRLPVALWIAGARGPVTAGAIIRQALPHLLAGGAATAVLALLVAPWPTGAFARLLVGGVAAYAVAWGCLAVLPRQRRVFAAAWAVARRR